MEIIDGSNVQNFESQILPEKEEKENFAVFDKNVPSPIKKQQVLNSPFDMTKLKYKNFPTSKQKKEKNFEEEFEQNIQQNEVYLKLNKDFSDFFSRCCLKK